MARTSAAEASDRVGVSPKFCQGDLCIQNHRLSAGLNLEYVSPSTSQVAKQIALVFVGRFHFYAHHGFQEQRFCLLERFPHGTCSRQSERKFVRIFLMSGAIQDVHMHINDRISGQNALLQSFLNTVAYGFQKMQRYIPARDEILD